MSINNIRYSFAPSPPRRFGETIITNNCFSQPQNVAQDPTSYLLVLAKFFANEWEAVQRHILVDDFQYEQGNEDSVEDEAKPYGP